MRIPHNHDLDDRLHMGCPNCTLIRYKLSPSNFERWNEDPPAMCTRGHAWDDNDILVNSQGRRVCRECRTENSQRWRVSRGYA